MKEEIKMFLEAHLLRYKKNDRSAKNSLEHKLDDFLNKYVVPALKEYFSPETKISDVIKLKLNPVTSIHLDPRIEWEIEPQGKMSSVYIFSSITFLILFIACMNFMNLSTAQANRRAKEVNSEKIVVYCGMNPLLYIL